MLVATRLTLRLIDPFHLLRGEVRADHATTVCGRVTRWPFPIQARSDVPLCRRCVAGQRRAGQYHVIGAFPNYAIDQNVDG